MKPLADAITAAENAQQVLAAAQATVQSDDANVTAIQAKLDAANAQKTTDAAGQASAVTGYNAALDDLIASATAAKIAVS